MWNFDDDCCAYIPNGAICADDEEYEWVVDYDSVCSEGDWG